ncbi:MAG: hypothetical protein HY736_04300 [Verrucomicrobia bacterium]|nr:hypothetical protein [Verrucomicrobiota bacterium]
MAGSPLLAQPTGGQVVAGTATFSASAGALTVTQTSARAIVNWQDFSIAAGASAKFVQPDALSAILNRVVSRAFGVAIPTLTASFTGFVNGDTASAVSGLQLSTATAASGVGGYAITPAGASAQNYGLTFAPGTLTIDRASLTLTAANAAREVGAVNPVFTSTLNGLVNGDSAAVVSGLVFSTPATAASVAGDYSIAPLGATAANYTLAFVNGTLRVNAPTVTVATTSLPVTTVNQQPALTPELAVILLGDRLVLIPVGSPNGVLTAAGGSAGSLDERLALTLGEVTGRPKFDGDTTGSRDPTVGGATSPGGPNFGRSISFSRAGTTRAKPTSSCAPATGIRCASTPATRIPATRSPASIGCWPVQTGATPSAATSS